MTATDRRAPRKSRTRRSAKSAGIKFQRAVADYLAAALDDDRIDVRPKRGVNDRGDIGSLRAHAGQRIVAECKDNVRVDLPGWTAEAHREAQNDEALVGVVVHKRAGHADPGQQWVSMTVDDWLACLHGQRFGHRRHLQ